MASRRFSLLFTSVLVTGVVVLYIISSKTENESSKVPEILSWKENVRIRSNNFTPTSRQRTQNEETSSFSYAEKLFKLYDEVESFVIFIGYPRSRHTLVAAMLDAHPEIITVDVYTVLDHLNQSSPQKNMQKYRIFFDIHQMAREHAMFGKRASPSSQLTKRRDSYFYNVPGAWQGGYQEKLKVIGVKNAGAGTTTQDRLGVMSRCKAIQQAVQVPLKFIHVIRNPFDNIATMTLYATGSRDAVRKGGVKVDNKEKLDAQIKRYFHMADNNQFVKEIYGDAVLNIAGHETVLRPRKTLQRLCDHLGVTCPEDYIEKCSKILFGNPSVTRHTVVWTEEQKERVTKMMQRYPFLKIYSFDKYPS